MKIGRLEIMLYAIWSVAGISLWLFTKDFYGYGHGFATNSVISLLQILSIYVPAIWTLFYILNKIGLEPYEPTLGDWE